MSASRKRRVVSVDDAPVHRPAELLAKKVRAAQRRDADLVERAAERELHQRDIDFEASMRAVPKPVVEHTPFWRT